MKKLIYIPAAAGVLAFGGIVLANNDTTEPAANSVNTDSQNSESIVQEQDKGENFLTFEEVSAKALEIADGKITDIELDQDDRRAHYEVDIDFEGYEYDLKFDAVSGELLDQDREKEDRDDDRESGMTDDKAASSENSSGQTQISSDEAIKAAMDAAGGGTLEEAELDHDDGNLYYDVEIRDGQTEHEITVNAYDGTIISHEKDQDDD